jgi:hypothetical protein
MAILFPFNSPQRFFVCITDPTVDVCKLLCGKNVSN